MTRPLRVAPEMSVCGCVTRLVVVVVAAVAVAVVRLLGLRGRRVLGGDEETRRACIHFEELLVVETAFWVVGG